MNPRLLLLLPVLPRKRPPRVVWVGVARRAFFPERPHAFLAVPGAGDLQDRLQLFPVAFVGAVPVPVHLDQPFGVAHGQVGVGGDLHMGGICR